MYGSYGTSLLQPVSGVTSVDTALELLQPAGEAGEGEGAGAGGPLPEGTYQGSCRDCVLDEEAQQLRCMCNDGSWGELEASLDVSGCVDGGIIENQNGQLNCVGPSVVGRCVHSLQRATESERPDGPVCCLSLTCVPGCEQGGGAAADRAARARGGRRRALLLPRAGPQDRRGA